MSVFQEQAINWLEHFELSRDESARVWLLSDDSSLCLPSTIDFESDNFGVSIIDPFDGRKPWLLTDNCLKSFQKNQTHYVKYIPTIILDSQMLTYLRKYLNNSLDRNQKKCIYQLLQFLIIKGIEINPGYGFDLNPTFYFIESLAKNEDINEVRKYADDTAIAVLRLHTMDEQAFLEDGCIIPDWQKLDIYKERYGLDSDAIKDLAPFWANTMLSDINEPFLEMCKNIVNYTYASLLKMILIHKESKKNAVKKLQEFYNFLEQEEFNLVLGREGIIAAYYFSNKLPDKFIQAQSEMTFAKVRKNLLGTAWDFFLLRMPEIMLLDGTEKQTALCYLCSVDKAIRKLGRLFAIESVISLSPNVFLPSSISLKLEEFKRDLGESMTDTLHDRQQKLRERRVANSQTENVNSISTEQLNDLISNLEEQIKKKCKE